MEVLNLLRSQWHGLAMLNFLRYAEHRAKVIERPEGRAVATDHFDYFDSSNNLNNEFRVGYKIHETKPRPIKK